MFAEYKEKLAGVVGDEAAAGIVAGSLFFVCAGTDDIANNYYLAPVRPLQYDISAYVDFLVEKACDFMRVGEIFFPARNAISFHSIHFNSYYTSVSFSKTTIVRVSEIFTNLHSLIPLLTVDHVACCRCSNCTSKGPGGSQSWGCRRSGACRRSGPSPAASPGTATRLATTRRSSTTPGSRRRSRSCRRSCGARRSATWTSTTSCRT